jgi:cytidylate kinase
LNTTKITIAIDGYSSTGKSTMAKQLANKLEYIYVDSGAMYRTVTLFAMQNGLISASEFDAQGLIDALETIDISFIYNSTKGYADVYLNGSNVSDQIRSIEVSNLVSTVAALPQVRAKLVSIQQEIGKNKGVVMDGRDIGTVVFPNAELKLFVSCSATIRAERRYKELIATGEQVTFEEVLDNIQKRDQLDTTRAVSPLVQASDAIAIDNSTMSPEEQFQLILNYAQQKIAQNGVNLT